MSIQKAYDDWSEKYDTDQNLTRDLDQNVTRETLAQLHFDSILEIGCGTGKNTAFLAQIGEKVHSVDFSERMLEKARDKVQSKNVQFSMMDITQTWSFGDQTFDLMVCNLVLEHVEDLTFVFAEAARTLKEKGGFFINELHPFKQYEGKKAGFYSKGEAIEVEAFVHHLSDYLVAAQTSGLTLVQLNEYWHQNDESKPPRIVSFIFEKQTL